MVSVSINPPPPSGGDLLPSSSMFVGKAREIASLATIDKCLYTKNHDSKMQIPAPLKQGNLRIHQSHITNFQ